MWGVPIKGLLTFKLCPSLTFPLQESEIEEVCVNENKCPLIVEVSPGSRLRLKFISVCQLRLKSGKYQVSHHRISRKLWHFLPSFVYLCVDRRGGGREIRNWVMSVIPVNTLIILRFPPPMSTPEISLPLIAGFYQSLGWAGVNVL